MTISELLQIIDSLAELEPRIEGSWGPSVELANNRKKASLKILHKELTNLQNISKIEATGEDNGN